MVLDWFKYPSWFIIALEQPDNFTNLTNISGPLSEKSARKVFRKVCCSNIVLGYSLF